MNDKKSNDDIEKFVEFMRAKGIKKNPETNNKIPAMTNNRFIITV